MSGVKGRSGRRARSVEETILALRDKARAITYRFLNDENQKLEERAKIANPIVCKDIVDKVENINPTTLVLIDKTNTKQVVDINRVREQIEQIVS